MTRIGNWLRGAANKVTGAVKTAGRWVKQHGPGIKEAIHKGANFAEKAGGVIGGNFGNALQKGAQWVKNATAKVENVVDKYKKITS